MRLLDAEPPLAHQAFDAQLDGRIYQQDHIVLPFQPRFIEQRHDSHDNAVAPGLRLQQQLAGTVAYRRMKDRLELFTRFGVGEHDPPHRRSIEPARLLQHGVAPHFLDSGESRLAGLDHFPCQDIAIDDGGAPRSEKAHDGRLTGADVAGEA